MIRKVRRINSPVDDQDLLEDLEFLKQKFEKLSNKDRKNVDRYFYDEPKTRKKKGKR